MKSFGIFERFIRRAVFAVVVAVAVFAMLLGAGAFSPASAQGLDVVEPTLPECRAFVEENGVPQTRPVWENRGYSGWDVCLNLAYDGDIAVSFGDADANSDGKLDAGEQSAYMDTVLGPGSDPDQRPLTIEKCQSLIERHGFPRERPFVDWSNRGYGETEVCQGLAYDGDLEGSFASADANGDGRLDRAEQTSFAQNASRGSNSNSSQSPQSSQDDSNAQTAPLAQDENAIRDQYSSAETTEAIEPTESTQPTELTKIEPTEPTAEITGTATEPETPGPTQERGVLSAVNTAVEGILPSTGGAAILTALAAVILLGGGALAYKRFR